ncbi:hypothetical protein, partial [Ferrimicrobium sp.]|uniref:hypothetical protein n=1 Tax=Ferrimicrobium sp. TaxID=2926050 RepID=UPI00263662F2
ENGRVPDMVDGVLEGEEGAIVGLDDRQDDGGSERDAEQGQKGGQRGPPEVPKGIGEKKER